MSGLVAQWITRLPTEQKIAGSIPAEIEDYFYPAATTLKELSIFSELSRLFMFRYSFKTYFYYFVF